MWKTTELECLKAIELESVEKYTKPFGGFYKNVCTPSNEYVWKLLNKSVEKL